MKNVKVCAIVYRFAWEILDCVLLSTDLHGKC
jgi:hypothetical protein